MVVVVLTRSDDKVPAHIGVRVWLVKNRENILLGLMLVKIRRLPAMTFLCTC